MTVKQARILPKGTWRHRNSFVAQYGRRRIGTSATVEAAKTAYENVVRTQNGLDDEKHLKTPVTYDENGQAYIRLKGSVANGACVKVDSNIWHLLTRTSWSGPAYPRGHFGGKLRKLHHVVFEHCSGITIPAGQEVDHRNKDTLDVTYSNVRLATRRQQNQNKNKKVGCSSSYVGVSFAKTEKKWKAYTTVDGKRVHIGTYLTEIEAVRAYNNRVQETGDEFTILNVIP